MSLSASRRGFLRGLTTLPLIGGGVALIGAPSAVAEPCTDATLDAYVALLAHEHRAALGERTIRDAERRIAQRIAEGGPYRQEYLGEVRERVRLGEDLPLWWRPEAPAIERLVSSAPPSSRAALVLSAVGAEWRCG